MGEPGFGSTAHTFPAFSVTIAMGSAAQTFTSLVRFDQTGGMDSHKSVPIWTGTSTERGATVDAMGKVCLLALTPLARVLVLRLLLGESARLWSFPGNHQTAQKKEELR